MIETLRGYRLYPVLLLLFFLLFSASSGAAVLMQGRDSASAPMSDRADVFVTLSVRDFENLSGHKLSLVERMYMKRVQKTLRRQLKKNPDLTITEYVDPVKKKFKLDPMWFTTGIIIGPLALLFAATSKQSKEIKKSAFLGFLIWTVWVGYAFIF